MKKTEIAASVSVVSVLSLCLLSKQANYEGKKNNFTQKMKRNGKLKFKIPKLSQQPNR